MNRRAAAAWLTLMGCLVIFWAVAPWPVIAALWPAFRTIGVLVLIVGLCLTLARIVVQLSLTQDERTRMARR